MRKNLRWDGVHSCHVPWTRYSRTVTIQVVVKTSHQKFSTPKETRMRGRMGSFKVLISLLFLMATFFGIAPGRSAALFGSLHVSADSNTTVTVHYHRFAGDYASWNLWMWPFQPASLGGAEYDFDGADSFGKVAHAQVPGANTQVGIIVRLGNFQDKDISQDRHVDTPNQHAEIWLIQGDANIYYSLADAQAALAEASKVKPVHAFLDGTNWAAVKFSHAVDVTSIKATDFSVKDLDTGQSVAVTGAGALYPADGATTDVIKVSLGVAPVVTHRLQVSYSTYIPIDLVPRLVLNDPSYFYGGNDLGATYGSSSTKFRLWAPLASKVILDVYKDEAGTVLQNMSMTKAENGTWTAEVSGDLKNMFYDYTITNLGSTATAVDPYARNIAVNGKYGAIVDLSGTNPSGWSADTYRKTKSPTDASIYEVHVRDFSINPDSGMKNKGKYLAFTETGTKSSKGVVTGVDSLKQLGVNYVQFLPVFGCNSVDEVSGGSTDLVTGQSDFARYNWCYDPRNYNAPNGAYATNPHGTSRISELKSAVQALHKRGMGVILDVVYNHTSSPSVFDPIVPNYYYRQDYSGTPFDSFGPNVAATRPMVCKFITDSVSYWMSEYHVDGFRFDIMSALGKTCMGKVSQALHKINSHTVLYGEPWQLLPTDWQRNLEGGAADSELTKGVQQNMGLAAYNDDLRTATVNDVFNANLEFATGDPTKGLGVMIGTVGETNFNSLIKGWAAKPSEALNYATNHDNQTLWDHIARAQPNAPEATRIQMDELSQAIIFTSQGIPLMQGGEEFLRSKGGNDNSYQAGDTVNMLDWNRKATYASVFKYYAGLLHLRAAHPALRMNSTSLVQNHLHFLDNVPQFVVAYKLTGHANGDKWKTIVVAFNPNSAPAKIPLSKGTWHVVASGGKIATKAFATAKGSASVPGYGAAILYQ